MNRLSRIVPAVAACAALVAWTGEAIARPSEPLGAVAAATVRQADPWRSIRLQPARGPMPSNAGRRYVLRLSRSAPPQAVTWRDARLGRVTKRTLPRGCTLQLRGLARDAALVACDIRNGGGPAPDGVPASVPFALDLATASLRRIQISHALLDRYSVAAIGLQWALGLADCNSLGCDVALFDRHTGKRHAISLPPGDRRRLQCLEDLGNPEDERLDLDHRPLRARRSPQCDEPLREGDTSVRFASLSRGGALVARRNGVATRIDGCRDEGRSSHRDFICSDLALRGGLVTWWRYSLSDRASSIDQGWRGYDMRTGRRYRFRTPTGAILSSTKSVALDSDWIYFEIDRDRGHPHGAIWRARWRSSR